MAWHARCTRVYTKGKGNRSRNPPFPSLYVPSGHQLVPTSYRCRIALWYSIWPLAVRVQFELVRTRSATTRQRAKWFQACPRLLSLIVPTAEAFQSLPIYRAG